MIGMKLSIIIPVYNERHTLFKLIERVRKVNIDKEIIIVDDCSTDGTAEIYPDVKDMVDKIVFHEKNMGKGAAIRTGIQYVTGDVTIIQDADLEYDPEEYHTLIRPIQDGNADVVYGSRFLGGNAHRVLFFWHMVGNRFLTLLSNMFTNLTLTDMETCYKMFRTDIIKQITIEQNRFGFEPEITAKLAKIKGIRFFEVGISYNGRGYEDGKKIGYKDGFNAIWCILKYASRRPKDTGKRTLCLLKDFSAYTQLIFSKFEGHIGSKVLEVGSGIGNNLPYFNDPNRTIILSDCREDYLEMLENTTAKEENISTHMIDLEKPLPDCCEQLNGIDTIICFNVLEHVKNDSAALSTVHDLLSENGILLLLVPAHQALFCRIDKELEHHRRYVRKQLENALIDHGFEIIQTSYFNSLGAIGWFIFGKIFRLSSVSPLCVRLQSKTLCFSKLLDCLRLPFGLSICCIAKKKRTL